MSLYKLIRCFDMFVSPLIRSAGLQHISPQSRSAHGCNPVSSSPGGSASPGWSGLHTLQEKRNTHEGGLLFFCIKQKKKNNTTCAATSTKPQAPSESTFTLGQCIYCLLMEVWAKGNTKPGDASNSSDFNLSILRVSYWSFQTGEGKPQKRKKEEERRETKGRMSTLTHLPDIGWPLNLCERPSPTDCCSRTDSILLIYNWSSVSSHKFRKWNLPSKVIACDWDSPRLSILFLQSPGVSVHRLLSFSPSTLLSSCCWYETKTWPRLNKKNLFLPKQEGHSFYLSPRCWVFIEDEAELFMKRL